MHTPGPWTVDPRTLAIYAPDRHGHAAAVRVAECGRTLLPAAEIAANAALLAISILALEDTSLRERLVAWRKAQTDRVLAESLDDAARAGR